MLSCPSAGLPEVWFQPTCAMLSGSGKGEETIMKTKREGGLPKMKGSFGTKPHDSERCKLWPVKSSCSDSK